jgi:hypothetical protein
VREQLEHMRSYRLGWVDGAGVRKVRSDDVQYQDDYSRGWQDGRKALRAALAVERDKLGLPVDSEILLQESNT